MTDLLKDVIDALPPLATAEQVAAVLNVKEATINGWRYQGKGPKAIKLEGAVRYPRRSVAAWLREREARDEAD